MILRTLVLAVAFAVAQSAPAPTQWHILDSTPQMTFSMDPASIQREGNTVTVTTRMTGRMADTGAETAMIAQLRFDCARRTSTFLHATLPGRDGRPVPYTPEPIESEPVAGHAGLEAALNELCPR